VQVSELFNFGKISTVYPAMGNYVSLRLCPRRPIKLMKVNRDITELQAPLFVHEISQEYPDHWIFDAETVRRLGLLHTLPLHQSARLQAGKIYCLVPIPPSINVSATSRLDELKARALERRGCFQIVSATQIDGDAGNTGVRVKVIMKKKDAVSLLNSQGTYNKSVDSVTDNGRAVKLSPIIEASVH